MIRGLNDIHLAMRIFAPFLVALFVSFMLTTTGASFIPAIAQITAPVLCDGELTFRFTNRSFHPTCVSKVTGQKTELSDWQYVAAGTLIYGSLCLVPLLPLTLLYARGKRIQANMKRVVLNRAIPATAKALSVTEGSKAFKRSSKLTRDVELQLTLEAQHPHLTPYQAATTWMVNELHFAQIQVGQIVSVKINADEPSRVYPNVE
jgi:hypothetical protein